MSESDARQMSSLVEVGRFFDPEEAYCARGLLNSAGIDVLLGDEHHLTAQPHLRLALGGFRLLVRSEQADIAAQLLAAPLAGAVEYAEHQFGEAEIAVSETDVRRPVRNFLWLPDYAMMGGFIPFLPLLKGNVRIAMQAVLLGVGFTAMVLIYLQSGDGH